MLLIGLTGGIGAGKSTVARLLAERGATVIEADQVAREVVEAGTPGLAAVVAEFGDGVLRADGSLDRQALAAAVFDDPGARERLNAIVHPLVRRRSHELMAAAPADAVVVYDVPLLAEAGLAGDFDLVVVVEAPESVRMERLIADRGMTGEEVRRRMRAQATDAQRQAVADVVLRNDGDRAALEAEVDRLWRDHVQPRR